MAVINNICCDNCLKTLSGIEKKATIKEQHIYFKGALSFEFYDEKTGELYFAYITPSQYNPIFFCNENCLKEWIVTRKEMVKQGIIPTYHPADMRRRNDYGDAGLSSREERDEE